ncbi:ACP S-malonyltransferase [Winogradskya humida]|uniref:Malonyl CoA-acyl carrier protein transacylase n=1 Tax=Winogradskya humida TaxID=113566 RepID=A0ABQ3ZYC1_9ACTN|nr:ACP S-malonyltransferase [Actinoplanes humidus]GIE23579.1 hypothetical protein Ahu01nite_066810 [Actinoplanes humidus]
MLALAFAGQGFQEKGMGADVFGHYPGLVQLASDILGYDLAELCRDDPDDLLTRTEYTQPAMFVVNALRQFERIRREDPPAAFYLGHSLGEYNALLAAGVLDFETGLRLVRKRGELMAAASGGGMTAVLGVTVPELLEMLHADGVDGVDLAGFNTDTQTVISGTLPVLEAAHRSLEQRRIRFSALRVSGPFHSRYMEPARAEFARYLSGFRFAEPQQPVIANVTGLPYESGTVAELLAEQLVRPVRWTDSIRHLLALDPQVEFSEIGGESLVRMARTIRKRSGTDAEQSHHPEVSRGHVPV